MAAFSWRPPRRPVDRRRAALIIGIGLLAGLSATHGECRAQDSARTTQLVGQVIDSLGRPISGAHVSVLPQQTLQAITSDSGRFAMDSVPVGMVRLHVRRLGYVPTTFTAKLESGSIQEVKLRLSGMVVVLPKVDVADTLAHPWLRIFEQRRAQGRGVFFTRRDIARSQVRSMSDLLRRVPGVEMRRMQFGVPEVVFSTGGTGGGKYCRPQVFVSSMNYSGRVDDFNPDDVEAMEVYTTISSVPATLQTARAQSCGAIVIWTREPPPVPQKKKGGGGGR